MIGIIVLLIVGALNFRKG